MTERGWWVSNVIITILLRKRWSFYVRVSLKRDEYHICMAQVSLQSLSMFKISWGWLAQLIIQSVYNTCVMVDASWNPQSTNDKFLKSNITSTSKKQLTFNQKWFTEMEKSHGVKSRNYIWCVWKEVDISDEKLQMRAVERKKGWSPSPPHCPVNLQCLKKKSQSKKYSHFHTMDCLRHE